MPRPDAILVRSARHARAWRFRAEVQAIGRAGAGTNNIPVEAMSARGVPVFNAPGANANAVKELVLAGMLIAARNLAPALRFVARLSTRRRRPRTRRSRTARSSSPASSWPATRSASIGLGKVGSLVADAAIKLGMNVLGYDPRHHRRRGVEPAVAGQEGAQRRGGAQERRLRHAARAAASTRRATWSTPRNIGADAAGAVLLNFSREGVVDDDAVLDALAAQAARVLRLRFSRRALLGIRA